MESIVDSTSEDTPLPRRLPLTLECEEPTILDPWPDDPTLVDPLVSHLLFRDR